MSDVNFPAFNPWTVEEKMDLKKRNLLFLPCNALLPCTLFEYTVHFQSMAFCDCNNTAGILVKVVIELQDS